MVDIWNIWGLTIGGWCLGCVWERVTNRSRFNFYYWSLLIMGLINIIMGLNAFFQPHINIRFG